MTNTTRNLKLFGAVEAGGTKFVCEVATADGTPLAVARIPTTSPAETLGKVLDFFSTQAAQHGELRAIGIAAFGPLDLRRDSPGYGHILATPKPQWSHTDLLAPFAQRFGCPVAIDTDVNAAALAETLQGAGRGCDVVVYVTVGTGIGGGVCVGQLPLHGASHPEMGHMRVLRHPRDQVFAGTCPFHGDCLEGLASGPALSARYGKALDELDETQEAVAVAGFYLGQLASTAILLLAPQRVIFGGGVMQHAALLPEVRRAAVQLLNGYAGLGDAHALEALIVAPGLGERSGIVGALLLAQAAYRAGKGR
jgi:fructokinase